jgi:predicted transcriptional regulator
MTRTAPFSMRLPPSLKAELQALAEREHRSLTNYIEVVLLQHIQREKGEARP